MIAAQCKMARAALGLGVRDLAKAAGVSPDTVARLERGEDLKTSTVAALQAALEAAGVQFIPENGGGAGVRMRDRPEREPKQGPVDAPMVRAGRRMKAATAKRSKPSA